MQSLRGRRNGKRHWFIKRLFRIFKPCGTKLERNSKHFQFSHLKNTHFWKAAKCWSRYKILYLSGGILQGNFSCLFLNANWHNKVKMRALYFAIKKLKLTTQNQNKFSHILYHYFLLTKSDTVDKVAIILNCSSGLTVKLLFSILKLTQKYFLCPQICSRLNSIT